VAGHAGRRRPAPFGEERTVRPWIACLCLFATVAFAQERTPEQEYQGYAAAHRYYPSLYLLHGYMNPWYEWDKQTQLASLLETHPWIVVLPQFDNSFYLDSAANPKDRYETYFFQELVPHVQARFRTRSEPPARAIAGISMGGYGALLLALHRPQAFSLAASFSGALDLAADADLAAAMKPFDLDGLLGPAGSDSRRRADLFAALDAADPAVVPDLWLTCGTQDFLLPQHLKFFDAARAKSLDVTFRAATGQHEWDYWRRELPAFFDALERRFADGG
jgi:S-formylglutathione hydrolase FrmB